MLRFAVLCCAVLRCALLLYTVLCCAVLCCTTLRCIVLYSTAMQTAKYKQYIQHLQVHLKASAFCRRLQDKAQQSTAPDTKVNSEAGVQEKHEAEIASMALAVLVRLTGNAGCVEALAEERALLLCYWLLHRPPGPPHLLLALRLLHALAITPPAAWAAAAQAGVVYLLTVLLPSNPPAPPFKV